jgi:hypothetical protein
MYKDVDILHHGGNAGVRRTLKLHAGVSSGQVFGSVTPRCPWYLPPRSL